jgi:hypothetical protein
MAILDARFQDAWRDVDPASLPDSMSIWRPQQPGPTPSHPEQRKPQLVPADVLQPAHDVVRALDQE